MIFATANQPRSKWTQPIILIFLCTGYCLAQTRPSNSSGTEMQSCTGLHAGIQVQLNQGTEEPSVLVSFILLNDGEKPIDVAAATWQIIIDGNPLSNSGVIFGNGPRPVGGWTTLAPGANYQLGKSFPISTYFWKKGTYKVSWRGSGFQSSTVTIE